MLLLSISLLLTGCVDSASTFPVAYSDDVAEMIDRVQQADVETYIGNLSGESEIRIGDDAVTLVTRNTANVEATLQVTQYAYEYMESLGLDVIYHPWIDDEEGIEGRNVIAEIVGMTRPQEIVIIAAHLDSMPEEGPAPGADDNASGSTGVMLAAASMAGYSFERTIRFVLFTGEEYGPSGSRVYADECSEKEEDILGVLNLDVMGWDENNDSIMFLNTREVSVNDAYQGDVDIANAFIDVTREYNIPLTVIVEEYETSESDTQSFWDAGYPAILIIEDETNESNPNWHEPTDTLATLNLPYCTKIIKASVGTAAHIALPVSEIKWFLLNNPFILL